MEIEYIRKISQTEELLVLEINDRVNQVVDMMINEVGIPGVLIEMLKIDYESLKGLNGSLENNLKLKITNILDNLDEV